MVVSPKEPAVNGGGPGLAIFDGLPPGPPYHIPVPLPEPGPWFLHVILVNGLGHAYRTTNIVVRQDTGGVSEGQQPTPLAFALEAAVPNPFRYRCDIRFVVPARSSVEVTVFSVTGRRMRTLFDGEAEAGVHRVSWDGTDGRGRAVAPGTYFVKMQAGGRSQTRTVTLLR